MPRACGGACEAASRSGFARRESALRDSEGAHLDSGRAQCAFSVAAGRCGSSCMRVVNPKLPARPPSCGNGSGSVPGSTAMPRARASSKWRGVPQKKGRLLSSPRKSSPGRADAMMRESSLPRVPSHFPGPQGMAETASSSRARSSVSSIGRPSGMRPVEQSVNTSRSSAHATWRPATTTISLPDARARSEPGSPVTAKDHGPASESPA